MEKYPTAFDDVFALKPRVFGDDRGFFFESFNAKNYSEAGVIYDFVQDNLSRSVKGTIRGLHYQFPNEQGKLVQILRGAVYDAVVDIRKGSPTFGKWTALELSAENRLQLWVPPGFAHGFQALTDETEVFYKVTDYWAPECEQSIAWNDPVIGIDWPLEPQALSGKDADAVPLAQQHILPPYKAPA